MRGIARAFVAVVAWTLVAAIGAGIATAQEEESASPSAEQKRTLTIGTTTDIRTTNPLRSLNVIEGWTFSYMYQGMLGMSREDLSAVPRLVEEWSQSEDGLTWTFTFRDDVVWSDGEPLTARDAIEEEVEIRVGIFRAADNVRETGDEKALRPRLQRALDR